MAGGGEDPRLCAAPVPSHRAAAVLAASTRLLPATLLILGLAATPGAGQQDEGQPRAFRSVSTELVVLPVVVTDRDGRFVTGLRREDFRVYDNGRLQNATFFSDEDTPVSVALVIDDSGSMREKLGQVTAAAAVFARASHPDDELFVIEFNENVRDALGGRSLRAEDAAELQDALRTLVPQGRTALYDALMQALDRLDRSSRPRRVMIVISDGADNASRASLEAVLMRARRSDVTIFTIGLFAPTDPDTNPGVLKRLAEATGGERFLPRSPGPLLKACERIAQEIRVGYTLGYAPPDRDGAFHRVRVELTRPGGRRYDIRTRPGYFAGTASRQ